MFFPLVISDLLAATMKENYEPKIGTFGYYVIFSGAGMAFMALGTYASRWLNRVCSDKILLSVILVAVALNVAIVSYFFKRYPRRVTVKLGIIGWLLTFILLFIGNWIN
jgi:hypothetical protein